MKFFLLVFGHLFEFVLVKIRVKLLRHWSLVEVVMILGHLVGLELLILHLLLLQCLFLHGHFSLDLLKLSLVKQLLVQHLQLVLHLKLLKLHRGYICIHSQVWDLQLAKVHHW